MPPRSDSPSPRFTYLNQPFPRPLTFSTDVSREPRRQQEYRFPARSGTWSSTSSTLESDLLRLHQVVGKPRARQGFISCDLCRSRKVKCPGEKPSCSMCLKKGIQCHYETRLRRCGPDRQPGARILKQDGIDENGHLKLLEYQPLPDHRPPVKRARQDALQLPPPIPREPPTSISKYHFEYEHEPTDEERKGTKGIGIGRLLDGGRVNGIRLPPLRMVLGRDTC